MKSKYILTILSCLAFSCHSVPEVNKTGEIILPQNEQALVQDSASDKLSELIKKVEGTHDKILLRYGTSFGMCTEYCILEMKITSVGIKYTETAWNMREDLPKLKPKVKAIIFSEIEWNELIAKINFNSFSKLDDRIGCPDCNDGGAEWIEIGMGGKLKKVTFEYSASIAEINNLLEPIRKLRDL